MKKLALASVLFLPLLLSGLAADTTEPPIAPPVPVNIAAIKARRAQIAELLKQDAADIAELQKQLKELGLSTELAPLGIGRPGKPGKDGHSPVLTWGTGTDADRIAIDGKFTGPHLTGPQGPPGGPVIPIPPADAFTKAINDAWAATPASEKSLLAGLITVWNNESSNLALEATNADIAATITTGRKAAGIGDTQLRAIRNVINAEFGKVFDPANPTQPLKVTLTDSLRAAAKQQMTTTTAILSTLK